MHDAITEFKAQFERSGTRVHLNNAGQSPISRAAFDTIDEWAKRFYEEGAHSWPPLSQALPQAREDVAKFLGARADELSFFQSAAGAISQVALGMSLTKGDEIIVWDQEYPSNFYPWSEAAKRSGARLIVAESGVHSETPIETISRLITPRTKVIATSWVQYRQGAIIDLVELASLARPKGIFTCVDIIQAAGQMPFDFSSIGIDAACGGSHKWMAACHGAGYLLLRRENLEKIRPLMVGAMTFGTPDSLPSEDAKMRSGSERFEPGGKAFIEILALAASARLLARTGIHEVSKEVNRLSHLLKSGLEERGYQVNSPHGENFRGSIVNFTPTSKSRLKDLSEIQKALEAKEVAYALRPPGIRLSPHAHNTTDEINSVLSLL